jgi:cellulose synthase/poly-beta-1,6-N-acetylglucosamine synthase-like glycosyltransferase
MRRGRRLGGTKRGSRAAGAGRRRLSGVVGGAVGATAAAPIVLSSLTGYLMVLTGAAWWARLHDRQTTPIRDEPTTRFAILVPAHNEERLIATTLRSLLRTDYPDDLFEVHVVADHCTDQTAEIVRAAGIEVHEHIDPEPPGKGPALAWLRSRLDERGCLHDVVVVIDADSIVDHRFLRVLDARFDGGARVVQAHYAVRDVEDSANAGVRAAALALRHFVRPLGRNALGASCGLYGNGMAFAADVLRRRKMSAHLTEDLELQTELVLEGEIVVFAPDAVVEAEIPTTLEASQTQNERWERGRIDLARRSIPRLLRRAVRARGRQRLVAIDTAFDHAVPPLSVLAAATVGLAGWFAVASRLLPSRLVRAGWRASQFALLGLGIHVVLGLRVARAPGAVYRSLLRAPRAIAWKVSLWLRMLVRPGQVHWIRTTRNAEQPATEVEPS